MTFLWLAVIFILEQNAFLGMGFREGFRHSSGHVLELCRTVLWIESGSCRSRRRARHPVSMCLVNKLTVNHRDGRAWPYLVLLPSAEDEVVVEYDFFLGNHNMLGCSVYGSHSTNHNIDPGAQWHQCMIFIIKTVAAERKAPSVTFEQLTGGIN